MDKTVLLVAVFAVVVVVAVVAVQYFQRVKRGNQMRDVAVRLGYEFHEKGDSLIEGLGGFDLIFQGRSRTAANVLCTEADGATATFFDYSHETGQAKNRRIHRQSALLLESERLDVPAFVLRPEGLGQKLMGLAGRQDIDFQDHQKFSGAYALQGPDEQEIRALFDGDKLDFFGRRPGMCVESNGRQLLFYRGHKLISPKAIPSFVEEGLAVLRLLAG